MTGPAAPRAVAVVVRDGRVLVVKRHYAGRDYAVLPGGGLEPGESFEAAAERELWRRPRCGPARPTGDRRRAHPGPAGALLPDDRRDRGAGARRGGARGALP